MPHDPEDRRALFQQVVDDILDQIRTGRLAPHDPLPSARNMVHVYGVASMTAQRALRELQHRRITYSIAGKGTFVHPDATNALAGNAPRPAALDDPTIRRNLIRYLTEQHAIVTRRQQATTAEDGTKLVQGLFHHAQANMDLIERVINTDGGERRG